MKQQFATLAYGSSFMHASDTSLGGRFDNLPIAVVCYIAYQEMMKKIGGTSNIVLNLRNDSSTSGIDLSQKMINIPLEDNYLEWLSDLRNL